MRAFVTGLDGFVGQWLARELIAHGDEVAGGSRNVEPKYSVLSRLEAESLTWLPFELCNDQTMIAAMQSWRPEAVYHLAAQASVADSFADPFATAAVNSSGTSHLVDAVAHVVPHATFLYVGSAEAYGTVSADELPIPETAPLRPNNPYAQSKAAGESAALERVGAVRAIATRSFNHIGPGQRTAFAVSSFARQLAAIRRAEAPCSIDVGNLSAKRDFTDVRDVVRAYRLLVERGLAGEVYNVCSGRAVAMQEILDMLIGIAGVPVEIRVDPARLRPVDTPVMYGDATKLNAATGWSPQIPLEQSLRDLFAWHLESL